MDHHFRGGGGCRCELGLAGRAALVDRSRSAALGDLDAGGLGAQTPYRAARPDTVSTHRHQGFTKYGVKNFDFSEICGSLLDMDNSQKGGANDYWETGAAG